VDWKALGVQVERDETSPWIRTDLIEQLRSIDWFQFELFVALVYRKLGYSVIRRGGANPDGGIDLIIEKNGQRAAVQRKQWKTWNAGVKAVREFLGALTHAKVQKGVCVRGNYAWSFQGARMG
jgi:restriction endonuclease Mrr